MDKTIALLTGSTETKEKAEIIRRLQQGDIQIVFGTHALLEESIRFKNLALIVIDEQHRFGVSQRAALYYKGNSVDLLVTTATPIPRTLLLGLYNDLSLSSIKKGPPGRKPVLTKIIPEPERDRFYAWSKTKLDKGGKAFIILPLIEKSDHFTDVRSIEDDVPYFKTIFEGLPMGIISGRCEPREKDRTIDRFRQGKIKLIIATTVIEVGIDVPDATLMVIENADRYGLAQLHQLRGRIGRSDLQSTCYLIPSKNLTESGQKRLKTIESTCDGFKIAETDLKMRGGGLISGFEQSGSFDFKIGDIKRDYSLLKLAQADAAFLLDQPEQQNAFIATHLKKIRDKIKNLNFS